MSDTAFRIRRLASIDATTRDALCDVLVDCVDGGASVSFLRPLGRDRADAFWGAVAADVERGRRAVLVAEDDLGLCGTVQLILAQPENQPHRADLVKLLVPHRARRRGTGTALMHAVVDLARECGKSLLVLDAVTGGDAARMYERLGWVRVGDVPGLALDPDGALCSATYYYLDVPAVPASRA